jgi:hypothetical protein
MQSAKLLDRHHRSHVNARFMDRRKEQTDVAHRHVIMQGVVPSDLLPSSLCLLFVQIIHLPLFGPFFSFWLCPCFSFCAVHVADRVIGLARHTLHRKPSGEILQTPLARGSRGHQTDRVTSWCKNLHAGRFSLSPLANVSDF